MYTHCISSSADRPRIKRGLRGITVSLDAWTAEQTSDKKKALESVRGDLPWVGIMIGAALERALNLLGSKRKSQKTSGTYEKSFERSAQSRYQLPSVMIVHLDGATEARMVNEWN